MHGSAACTADASCARPGACSVSRRTQQAVASAGQAGRVHVCGHAAGKRTCTGTPQCPLVRSALLAAKTLQPRAMALAQPVTARGPCHTARRTAAPGAQRSAPRQHGGAPHPRARSSAHRSSNKTISGVSRPSGVCWGPGRLPSREPGPLGPAGAGRTSSAGAAASAAPSSASSSSSEPGWWPSACSRIAAFFSAAAAATPGRGRPSAGLRAAAARWGVVALRCRVTMRQDLAAVRSPRLAYGSRSDQVC